MTRTCLRRRVTLGLALAWLTTLLAGCALFGKGKPRPLRYFDLSADATYAPTRAAAASRLRLGQISAARHIDRRFVERTSSHEIRYHEQWRWTDQPEAFLRGALRRDLFERAGLIQVVSGPAPTLEVELVAFEAENQGGRQRACAAVLASLHDDREQLWQRRFEVEQDVGAGDPAEALAEAMGRALADVAAKLTAQTLTTLAAPD